MIFDEQALRLLGKPIVLLGLADLPRSAATIQDADGSGASLSGSLMPMPCVAFQGCHRTPVPFACRLKERGNIDQNGAARPLPAPKQHSL
jgi:hypothetical protein